jgi:hypothetical protein
VPNVFRFYDLSDIADRANKVPSKLIFPLNSIPSKYLFQMFLKIQFKSHRLLFPNFKHNQAKNDLHY